MSVNKMILKKKDDIDGYIYACPYCHRYVTIQPGSHACSVCGRMVDNDKKAMYTGKVIFDGKESWKDIGKGDDD